MPSEVSVDAEGNECHWEGVAGLFKYSSRLLMRTLVEKGDSVRSSGTLAPSSTHRPKSGCERQYKMQHIWWRRKKEERERESECIAGVVAPCTRLHLNFDEAEKEALDPPSPSLPFPSASAYGAAALVSPLSPPLSFLYPFSCPCNSVTLHWQRWRTTMWTSTFTLLSSALLLALTCHAKAGETGEERNLTLVGSPCNPNNTRLLVDNNQLQSECGYLAWCDAGDLTCKVRGCRRDEWPFGFNKKARDLWPPKCGYEEFCPDEGSLCMVKVGLGEPCQLSRDGECVEDAE